VQRELPRRLARRLLDLQLLPHIVVTNPHVTRVYHAYYHAFETLRQLPPVGCCSGPLLGPPCLFAWAGVHRRRLLLSRSCSAGAERAHASHRPPSPRRQVTSPAENVAFCTLLRRLVDEHAPMLDSLAQGLREAKVGGGAWRAPPPASNVGAAGIGFL
jgi:hypothetical protein